MKYWHWTDGRTLRDGSPLIVGEWTDPIEDVEPCHRGYHASERIIDAMWYAPGGRLSEVELRGIIEDNDKVVGSQRRVIRTADATQLCVAIAYVATDYAYDVIANADSVYGVDAYAAVRDYADTIPDTIPATYAVTRTVCAVGYVATAIHYVAAINTSHFYDDLEIAIQWLAESLDWEEE